MTVSVTSTEAHDGTVRTGFWALTLGSIGVVFGDIGTSPLYAFREAVTHAAAGAPVGLYCGSLYPDKRLDLLLAAAEKVHEKHPGFRLVVVGDGPSRPFVTDAARRSAAPSMRQLAA